jgi:hypothetical protein
MWEDNVHCLRSACDGIYCEDASDLAHLPVYGVANPWSNNGGGAVILWLCAATIPAPR